MNAFAAADAADASDAAMIASAVIARFAEATRAGWPLYPDGSIMLPNPPADLRLMKYAGGSGSTLANDLNGCVRVDEGMVNIDDVQRVVKAAANRYDEDGFWARYYSNDREIMDVVENAALFRLIVSAFVHIDDVIEQTGNRQLGMIKLQLFIHFEQKIEALFMSGEFLEGLEAAGGWDGEHRLADEVWLFVAITRHRSGPYGHLPARFQEIVKRVSERAGVEPLDRYKVDDYFPHPYDVDNPYYDGPDAV